MQLCLLGSLSAGASDAWAAGMYAAVVRLDRTDEECARLATGIEVVERAGRTIRRELGRELRQELRRAWEEVKLADGELERLFAEGLQARSGSRLQGEDEFTDVHVAARLEPRPGWRVSRWRACERCGYVFEARRNARRCAECRNKRARRPRPASRWRQCTGCSALFEPGDTQQSTCDRCQATKSSRSRHPDRPAQPGTPYRRATIDFPRDERGESLDRLTRNRQAARGADRSGPVVSRTDLQRRRDYSRQARARANPTPITTRYMCRICGDAHRTDEHDAPAVHGLSADELRALRTSAVEELVNALRHDAPADHVRGVLAVIDVAERRLGIRA
jgi:hypothetical protein